MGFRPYVHRLARELGLAGHVGNDSAGAFIEVEGRPGAIEAFARRLRAELPPLARIAEVTAVELPPTGQQGFAIGSSESAGPRRADVTPDSATCEDCLAELLDPTDRRYRYPFINCTNCGPRYSIVRMVPYDRANTTMAVFQMCPACRREYDDPSDRRFHAQPNACPACGPKVWLTDGAGNPVKGDTIRRAAELLDAGKILAIKGLGGFHLACRADDEQAVAELRRRKNREAKPLALMARDEGEAARLIELSDAAREALAGPERPIVVARPRQGTHVAASVAPGSPGLGVMLPYTPLHTLLMQAVGGPLVMTSGNPSSEPLCRDNDEALARLGLIADAFVLHDRDIERRVDDSVLLAVDLPGGPGVIPLRRARGYVPAPTPLATPADVPTLAVGAEMKSTVCVVRDGQAVVSEHLGDLDNPEAYRNFIAAIEQFQTLLDARAGRIVCDLHPAYASRRWAMGQSVPVEQVQHHHAHLAGCLAENRLDGSAVALACDGTGYGTDGTVWGGEILVGDRADSRRAGHLWPIRLVGGDAAAVETWRPALATTVATFGVDVADWPAATRKRMDAIDAEAVRVAVQRIQAGAGTVCTSLGRLFDAVAFWLGLADLNRCQAEAPMALEAAATMVDAGSVEPLPWSLAEDADGIMQLDWRPALGAMLTRAADGEPAGVLARAFHEMLADMLASSADRAADRAGVGPVLLTGGCFANRLLLEGVWRRLLEAGRKVYTHYLMPPGDGGVSLGQAVCALARAQRGD